VRRVWLTVAICAVSWGQTQAQWDSVRKLYIAPLGDDAGATLVHDRIAKELAASGRFEVVDAEDQADAVLSGEGQRNKNTQHKAAAHAKPHDQATAKLQLKTKDQTVLWSGEESFESGANRAAVMLGREVARKLVKASTPKDKKKS
jgi:hypothetical protein